MTHVVIPYVPRAEFQPFHDSPKNRAIIVAHRRAGKTVAAINHLIRAAVTCQKVEPRFAYCAPLYSQAKDVAWTYLKRFGLVVPNAAANEAELRIDFPNGGRVRLYGTDNYDSLRGLYFDGVVLDEYGDMNPRAWQEVFTPCLSDRRGWALFIGTPRGDNHFHDKWREARENPDRWYSAQHRVSITGLVDEDVLAEARRTMTAEQYAAEYECSFSGSVVGAYYAREMAEIESNDRAGAFPWVPDNSVVTAWDLGIGDSTAIWVAQCVRGVWRVIDFVENSGCGLRWYVDWLRDKPYSIERSILPHDASNRDAGSGLTRIETLNSLGFYRTDVLPRTKVDDGINAARLFLQTCVFDNNKNVLDGIKALRNYRKQWDDNRKVFHDRPLHDWSSHAADAFRYLAMGVKTHVAANSWNAPINYPPSVFV